MRLLGSRHDGSRDLTRRDADTRRRHLGRALWHRAERAAANGAATVSSASPVELQIKNLPRTGIKVFKHEEDPVEGGLIIPSVSRIAEKKAAPPQGPQVD
jgi:hypothetical protein